MMEEALHPREDLYTGIHKALRALLCDTLVRAGAMDVEDGEETAVVLAAVRNLIDLTRHHLHHENQHVHPLLEARVAGATASLMREHIEHEEAFERLEAAVRAVEQAAGAARAAAALALYRELALYAAEDFRHMHEEETRTNALLWERCTDAELKAAHHAIVSGIAPDLMARYVRWLVPSMTPAERAALLAGAQASVPPQVFAGMLQMVRPLIGEAGWAKLGRALALPRAA
ncbi:MAG TPA: hemerythrin domain-containing protein [Burkholderiales bacterium]|nr:hemerythrin domain-containing protein [Burkholderiales bacterium]